ncbi:MAG: hypothetical protein ABSA75_10280 [Candidatus Bathyarchaeia archaeon]|jgi:hypothetical protein
MNEGFGVFKIGNHSQSGLIFVPSKVTSDSTFPLKAQTRVKITIDNKRLIIVEAAE